MGPAQRLECEQAGAAGTGWLGGVTCLGQSAKVTLGRRGPNGNLRKWPGAPVGSLWELEQV